MELVKQAQGGSTDAFAQLIARYERIVLALVLAATGDGQTAGDLAQETFLQAWSNLASLQDPGRFGPWLVSIARNLAVDHHRRTVRSARLAAEAAKRSEQLQCPPHHVLEQQEMRLQLKEALARLDEVSRCAVMLRYYDNLSSREIGQLLGLSPTAVDMRLSRARAFLRSQLQPDEPVRSIRLGAENLDRPHG